MLAILVRKNADRQKATLGSAGHSHRAVARAPRRPPISPSAASTIAARRGGGARRGAAARRAARERCRVPGLHGAARDSRARAPGDQVRARRSGRRSATRRPSSRRCSRWSASRSIWTRSARASPISTASATSRPWTTPWSRKGEGPDQEYGLEVRARRKSWGPNYVRFGLNLEANFQGNNQYNAAARVSA